MQNKCNHFKIHVVNNEIAKMQGLYVKRPIFLGVEKVIAMVKQRNPFNKHHCKKITETNEYFKNG